MRASRVGRITTQMWRVMDAAWFHTRPVELKAIQFVGTNISDIKALVGAERVFSSSEAVYIREPGRFRSLMLRDWVIWHGTHADVVSSSMFDLIYEPITERKAGNDQTQLRPLHDDRGPHRLTDEEIRRGAHQG